MVEDSKISQDMPCQKSICLCVVDHLHTTEHLRQTMKGPWHMLICHLAEAWFPVTCFGRLVRVNNLGVCQLIVCVHIPAQCFSTIISCVKCLWREIHFLCGLLWEGSQLLMLGIKVSSVRHDGSDPENGVIECLKEILSFSLTLWGKPHAVLLFANSEMNLSLSVSFGWILIRALREMWTWRSSASLSGP